MRVILTIICLVVVPALLNAQITIGSGDIPVQPGMSDTFEATDNAVAVNLGSPGAG